MSLTIPPTIPRSVLKDWLITNSLLGGFNTLIGQATANGILAKFIISDPDYANIATQSTQFQGLITALVTAGTLTTAHVTAINQLGRVEALVSDAQLLGVSGISIQDVAAAIAYLGD